MIKQTLVLIFAILMLQAKAQTSDSVSLDDVTFTTVETEASFKGGTEAWKQYLQKNLRANVPAKKGAPSGTYTVVIRFIVDKNGSISDIQPETKWGYGMEQEVVRVIKKGPKWEPAIQAGRPVRAYRRQPITFMISDK